MLHNLLLLFIVLLHRPVLEILRNIICVFQEEALKDEERRSGGTLLSCSLSRSLLSEFVYECFNH